MGRWQIEVRGTVQGVGFRPFVYRLARLLSLNGFVRNTPEGVFIEIEGTAERVEAFRARLLSEAPPMARITKIDCTAIPPKGESGFTILSSGFGLCETFVPPDIGVCEACIQDISEKENRRYRYPFTNCTDCGPRFSIVEAVPYDRPHTSMDAFVMCPDCRAEYGNPDNRRFHAQPNACRVCGPELAFIRDGQPMKGDPFALFEQAIRSGGIVAVKGLGGFHLVCDAKNEQAVRELRRRKARYEKPLAVMARDLSEAKRQCIVTEQEEAALLSPQKPIVLLRKRTDCGVAFSVSGENARLGVMLPYTPLHFLLTRSFEALVMTSGNLSDEPMVFSDSEAPVKLFSIADAALTHDRRIVRRVDDSVGIVVNSRFHLLRRARGYVPEPLFLKDCSQVIFAGGADQKNTFCLTRAESAFLSGHIGDLGFKDAARCFESEVAAFMRLFDASPSLCACDLHPDYVSSKITEHFALERGLPLLKIQHHHAHFASVLAEHGIENEAIGFSFDGTGCGTDGTVWGGEALFGGIEDSKRLGHNLCFPLIGGDSAVKEPYRAALAAISAALGDEAALSLFGGEEPEILLRAGKAGVNAPLTSSMGRLFDAVAAVAGVRTRTSYEGQAAIELMQYIDTTEKGAYGFGFLEQDGQTLFDWRPVIAEAVKDRRAGLSAGVISRRFHSAVIKLITDAALRFHKSTGCKTIALSGGVFQNEVLLEEAFLSLSGHGFSVYTNEKIPCNDGGISFGQAAAAARRME